MKIRSKELYRNCYGKRAIVAVNVFAMEQVLGLFKAAKKAESSIIAQTTPAAWAYASAETLIRTVKAAASLHPKTVYALPYGASKVNIATGLRPLWRAVHRKFFCEKPELFDPTVSGKTYVKAVGNLLIDRFKILGSVGKTAEFL